MAILAIDKLKSNPKSRVVIVGKGFSVTAFVIGEFTIGGTNDYQSIFELTGQEELQKTLLLGKSLADATRWGKYIPNLRIKSVTQSELTWMSSARPTFNLQLLFISVKPDDIETKGDIRKDVKTLLATTYPKFNKALKTSIISPPLNYNPKKAGGTKNYAGGTVQVSIGTWFRAPKQVIHSVSSTFSKEVVANGTPLYANVTLEFGPYRMISSDEIQRYLKGVA